MNIDLRDDQEMPMIATKPASLFQFDIVIEMMQNYLLESRPCSTSPRLALGIFYWGKVLRDMLESVIIVLFIVIALAIGANLLLGSRNRKD
jgi:hypothetical protein